MVSEKIKLFSLSREQMCMIMSKSGCASFTEKNIDDSVKDGFRLNEDGSIDIFDYVCFKFGEKQDITTDRNPPKAGFNIKSVKPSELAGWLSMYSHMGYVIPKKRMTEVCSMFRSSFASSDGTRNVDFLRFAAFSETYAKPKVRGAARKLGVSTQTYEERKDAINRINKEKAASARDIGSIPDVKDPERRDACHHDFRKFCETYLSSTFSLSWSRDHISAIAKIEKSVISGGLFAFAMPRGSGKTSLSEAACIWAILFGHAEFVFLVGATESASLEMFDSIKTEIETNELLEEDFPEVCFPIHSLEGIANRCNGQTCMGERTRITWTSNELVFPTTSGSLSSGSVLRCAGLTGRIRGMKYKKPDGRTIRPGLVVIDDPQTSESARSIEQNRIRVRILSSDILGLAGPGKKISGIMPCTVIEPGDMAEQILDRSIHPEWNGERSKLLYRMPSNMELWDRYADIRGDCLRSDGNIAAATEFYREHRDEMDEGADPAWPERFENDEISAVQNAMDLFFRDPAAFAAEYQNEPLKGQTNEEQMLSADAIALKLNGLPAFTVPLECTRITCFVDVQKKGLFYTVCAWSDDFTGAVIDYGTYPKQSVRRFSCSNMSPSMQEVYPGSSIEGQIYSSLTDLFSSLANNAYVREDGIELHIEKAAIDANWGQSTDIVYQFCRQSDHAAILIPAHGHYIGASSRPMSDYNRQRGDRHGLNWYIPSSSSMKRAVRHVVFDTNFWKSFVHSRFCVPIGSKGCMTLYGRSPTAHELYSEHLTAEYRVKTSGRGRTVDEWKMRPDRTDNHWLDCTAGCAMLASMCGSSLPQTASIQPVKKDPVVLSSVIGKDHTLYRDPVKAEKKDKNVLVLSMIKRK